MGKNIKLKLGKRKSKQTLGGWSNCYVQPSGKYWKRYFNKKGRRQALYNGSFYKKVAGWFEWC